MAERSRFLILFPLVSVLQCSAVGIMLMHRYRFAINNQIFRDAYRWAGYEGTNGLILLGFAIFTFVINVVLIFELRRSFRSFVREVERAGKGGFDFPLHYVSEREVFQLQEQFGNLVQTVNRLIEDTGMGATITVDMDGNVSMINPLGQLLLETTPNAVIGESFGRLLAGDETSGNRKLIQAISSSLEAKEPLQEEAVEIVLPSGRRINVRVRTSFIATESGNQMVVVLADRNLADITSFRDGIERAARFLMLGSLAPHLAHEVRNPLASVAGLVELLKEEIADTDDRKRAIIAQIEKATERLNRLLEGLMDIASLEKCALVPLHAEAIVQDVVRTRRNHDPRAVDKRIIVHYDDNLPLVKANAEWLTRAVMNLLGNALDATPSGGTISLDVSLRHATEQTWGRPCIDIAIQNSGSYIPEEQRQRVFEPFVTGKNTGTGLGLCIVQQVVQAHGGIVFVNSDPDQGTRFVMRIPVCE